MTLVPKGLIRGRRIYSIKRSLFYVAGLGAYTDGKILPDSKLFDPDYYFMANPDARVSGHGAIEHYVKWGAKHGFATHPMFDSAYYVRSYPHVVDAGMTPLTHFLREGAAQGYRPHPLFETKFYCRNYPEVISSGLNPLIHYLTVGAALGYQPHPLFDPQFYLSETSEDISLQNALIHYLSLGRAARRRPHRLFDGEYYIRTYPHVVDAGMTPLTHFLREGVAQGYRPHPLFATKFYCRKYPEVISSGLNPLIHYLMVGAALGYQPHPLFDPHFYLSQVGEDVSLRSALFHYLSQGRAARIRPHPMFDSRHYLRSAPNIEARLTPLEHYIAQGSDEFNSPNTVFDERFYRMSYGLPSDSSALEHYVTEGLRAGCIPSGSLRPGGILSAIVAQKLLQNSALVAVSTLSTLLGIGTADGFQVIGGRIRRTIDEARLSGDLLSLPDYPRLSQFTAPTFNTPAIERRGAEVSLPEPYLARFVGARVLPGRRFIITNDGRLLHELLGDERAGRFEIHLPELRATTGGCGLVVAQDDDSTIKEGILLSSDADENYFHWLMETLPRLLLVKQGGIDPRVPLLVLEGLHENLIAALLHCADGREIIYLPRGKLFKVELLYVPGGLSRIVNNYASPVDESYDCVMNPAGLAFLKDHLTPSMNTRSTRRIYLKRGGSHRSLENEVDLIDALRPFGFSVVEPGNLSLQEQIDIVHGARIIVGPAGAGMSNLLFGNQSARALMLVSNHPQLNFQIFNQIARFSGVLLDYEIGTRRFTRNDEYSIHDSYCVNLDSIRNWLKRYA